MISIELDNNTYQVPETWNELTGRQLVAIMMALDMDESVVQIRLTLFCILAKIRRHQLRRMDAEAIMERLYLADWILYINTLTKNVLPRVAGFRGPGDDFENLQMCEFVYSEDFFMRWKEEENHTDLLNNLVAVLYRTKKKKYNEQINADGDARRPFNEYESAYHARRSIAKWPLARKLAIAHWYDGCRNKLVQDFPTVFGGTGGNAAKYGLVSIIRNVAAKGVHGNFKAVENTPVRLILMELDEMQTESEAAANL